MAAGAGVAVVAGRGVAGDAMLRGTVACGAVAAVDVTGGAVTAVVAVDGVDPDEARMPGPGIDAETGRSAARARAPALAPGRTGIAVVAPLGGADRRLPGVPSTAVERRTVVGCSARATRVIGPIGSGARARKLPGDGNSRPPRPIEPGAGEDVVAERAASDTAAAVAVGPAVVAEAPPDWSLAAGPAADEPGRTAVEADEADEADEPTPRAVVDGLAGAVGRVAVVDDGAGADDEAPGVAAVAEIDDAALSGPAWPRCGKLWAWGVGRDCAAAGTCTPAEDARAGRGRAASSVSLTRTRRRSTCEASPGVGEADADADAAGVAAETRAGSPGASPSAAWPESLAPAPRLPDCPTERGARAGTRRLRASAGVVIRPTAATSSGSCIGTTRAASPAGTVPGRREPSTGTEPTARGNPRAGSSAASSPPVHQRGGRMLASSTSTSCRAAPAGRPSSRRTAPGRPQLRANRLEEDATSPTRVVRRPPRGPGRRNRCPTALPSRVAASDASPRCGVTSSPPGTRCGRPQGSRSGLRRSRPAAAARST